MYGSAPTINLVDARTGKVNWSAITFSDEQSVVLNSAGAIQSGPKNVDQYLTWILQYPGGREVTLTRQQFHRRVGLDPGRQAINWILDLGGELTVESSDSPMKRTAVTSNSELPEPSAVTAVALNRVCNIADSSLDLIQHLTSIRDLNLSGTHITRLPSLSAAGYIKQCDFSFSFLEDIDGLAGLTELKELNLAGTPVTSTIGQTLASLVNLESLDLSNTQVNEFVLTDLAALRNLTTVRISGVDIPEAALIQFRSNHPNCKVTTD